MVGRGWINGSGEKRGLLRPILKQRKVENIYTAIRTRKKRKRYEGGGGNQWLSGLTRRTNEILPGH